jgi:hypothetical protein
MKLTFTITVKDNRYGEGQVDYVEHLLKGVEHFIGPVTVCYEKWLTSDKNPGLLTFTVTVDVNGYWLEKIPEITKRLLGSIDHVGETTIRYDEYLTDKNDEWAEGVEKTFDYEGGLPL